METTNYYIHKIKDDLSKKQRSNPQYSLRSYAKFLGLHSSTLSQVIGGKRSLPLKSANEIALKLALDPKERTLFFESIYRKKTKLDDIKIDPINSKYIIDESYYNVIKEWEHYAVLTLFDIPSFIPSTKEISSRLGITENRTEVVITNLLTCGLLKKDNNNQLIKAHSNIRTTEDITSSALIESHKETLDMSKNKLDEIQVELRDFSAMTIAMDLERMPEVKTIIREFRQKMSSLLRDGKETDVCQLAIQFYPLTKNKLKH